MFMAKNKVKGWANAIIGFAILFMGLGFLKDAVPDLDANSGIVQFFTQFSDSPFLGRIAFVLLYTSYNSCSIFLCSNGINTHNGFKRNHSF